MPLTLVSEILSALNKPLNSPQPRNSRNSAASAILDIATKALDDSVGEEPTADIDEDTGVKGGEGGLATAERRLPPLPPEVPTLPEAAVHRPELIAALAERVLRKDAAASMTSVTAPMRKDASRKSVHSSSNTTTANGMGGVGKTMLAAAFVRETIVRAAFDRICWVSVGQEPDTLSLQVVLYRQMVNRPLPDAFKTDELLALGELKEAAKELKVRPLSCDV